MISVYKTNNGEVRQDDKKNCLQLVFKGNEYNLKLCSFIGLKARIDRIDVAEMLLSDSHGDGIEIVPICNFENILVLTIDEILEIKDLLAGSVVLLELNSILHQRIHRAIA